MSDTVLVFTTTLPSGLPLLISSIQAQSNSQTAIAAQTTESAPQNLASENGAAAAAEASIIDVLTSAGIPSPAAESLGAMIIGSTQNNSQTGSDTSLDQERQSAAIQAVLQWLLSYINQ